MRLQPALTLALAAAATACSLAPAYHAPDGVPAAANYAALSEWKPAAPAAAAPRGAWWQVYGNETLNGLEERLAPGNQDLKAGLARLEQARAGTRIACCAPTRG